MKDRYKEILEGLQEDNTPKHQNDRILIIDGLNTFIRSFAVNPSVHEDGIHVGGLHVWCEASLYVGPSPKQALACQVAWTPEG